ncbi:head-tail adaptor protein [Yoonia sp. R2331]|uniref:head-tail adaptor protein n=1 Tax=Yoonia sp. R2331 TaxID=3237238 RepID=UPI0034E4C20E
MKAPVLNRQLTLEDSYRVPDNAGGFTTEWQPLGQLWAQVIAGTGREQAVNALPLSRVPYKVTVRAAPVGAPSRPHAGQRFREGSRIFSINAVTEQDSEGRYLLCQAQEEVAV